MCSDCSSFLFFEASQRKHRVCSACVADHSAATRAARQSQRDALFDDASDAEPQRTSMATGTPSSVASDKRGGFRTSVLHAITPKSGKRDKKKKQKKTKKNSATSNDQQRVMPANELSGNEVPAADARGQGTGPGLFNSAGDTWFTEPADEGEDDRKQTATSGMGRAFPDADYSDGFADSTNSNSRTAADEWRDQVKASYELQLDPTPRVGVAAPTGFGFGRKDFSEQYRYDDDPLEYEDDDKISAGYKDPSDTRPSMPRPDPAVSFESRLEPASKVESPRRAPPVEEQAPEQLHQSTLKVNLKGLFHGKSKEKRERRRKSKKSRAERRVSQRSEDRSPIAADSGTRTPLNQRMTLDELEITPKPVTVGASALRPTFYDDDADELVVDDTPGYFEANLAKTSADHRKQEELQRKLAEDAAWINGAAAPIPSGNRFSSGQESFSIVDAPSHGASSPESATNNTSSTGPGTHEDDKGKEHGFTGALKRFFGMSTAKTPEKPPTASTEGPKPIRSVDPPGPIQTPAPIIEEVASRRLIADNYKFDAEDRALSFRHSVGDMTQLSVYERQDGQDFAALRYTMAGNLDAQSSIRPGTFMVPDTQPANSHREPKKKKSSKSLKRRDTFDDLFESPKAVDRHNEASSDLPTRSWGEVAIENTPGYSVGVSRFDAYRDDRENEADDFMPDNHNARARASDAYRASAIDARYNSAPALKSRRDSEDAFGSPTRPTSAFTWNSVQATPGFGTASYAVPVGIPPRDSRFGGDRFASNRADSDDGGTETPHNIMQDLHRRSVSAGGGRKRSTADSVDDIFAQFERPNDYVFDPATGSYVPARPAPRASRREKEVSSAPRQSYEPNDVAESRSSVGRRSSDRVRAESSYEVKPVEPRPVDRSGEDSESNESDDVIVDKISSLEGELAALKRLIKKRKGGNTNPDVSRSTSSKRKPKLSSSASGKPRKESIFDGDSSESDKEMPGSRWPTSSTRKQKRETVKLQPRKARRDSFASLFDDNPVEGGSIAGAGGYDALFQTGPSKSDESGGDDKDESRSPMVRRSGKRKPSKKFQKKDAESTKTRALDDFDAQDEDEAELASLKNKRSVARRRRSSKERTAPSWANDSPDEAPATTLSATGRIPEVKAPSTARASSVSKAIAVEEEDPIDALFDSSNDTKMSDLYGGDTATTEERAEPAESEKTTSRRSSSRSSKTRRRLSDGDSDEDTGDAAPALAPVALQDSTKRSTSSLAINGGALTPLSVSTADGSDPDSEEEFAINWKKVKSGRARRQTRPSAMMAPPVSFVTVTGTDLMDGSDEDTTKTAEPTLEVNETLVISQDASEGADGDSSEHEMPASDTASKPVTSVDVDGIDSLRTDHEEAAETSPAVVQDESNSPLTAAVDASESDNAEESSDLPISTESAAAVESSHVDADSTMTPLATPSFTRSRVDDDLFKGDDDDGDVSVGLFDRSNDMDLHSLMGGGSSTLYDEDFAISTPDTPPAPSSSSLLGEKYDGDASSSGEENGDDAGFSFEIQPQRRRTAKPFTVETTAPRSNSISSTATADEDDQGSVLLGKYARAPPLRVESSHDGGIQLGASFSSVDTSSGADAADGDVDTSLTAAVDDAAAAPRMSADSADAFDADWQAMQEQEKQRKKKLQMKQRQAQRDKLMLKKQHSKMLANDASADGKSGKKQKKKKKSSKDDGTSSSKKHRHREKEAEAERCGAEPEAVAGSLTEL